MNLYDTAPRHGRECGRKFLSSLHEDLAQYQHQPKHRTFEGRVSFILLNHKSSDFGSFLFCDTFVVNLGRGMVHRAAIFVAFQSVLIPECHSPFQVMSLDQKRNGAPLR